MRAFHIETGRKSRMAIKELFINSNVIASALGSILAAGVAFVTIYIQNKFIRKRDEGKRHSEKVAFIKSIKAELTALQERYMEAIGTPMENKQDVYYWPGGLIENYHSIFVFYDNNVNQISLLNENQDLKAQIIRLYIDMKALFDMWVYYNDFCSSQSYPVSGTPSYYGKTTQDLHEHFQLIKQMHFRTKERLNETIDNFLAGQS